MKKFFTLFLTTVLCISCKSGTDLINDAQDITLQIIENSEVISKISKYQDSTAFNKNKYRAIILVVDESKSQFGGNSINFDDYYITSTSNLSYIYRYPLSRFSIINNELVLIYYKNGYFVNPRNYSKLTVFKYFRPKLNNDWFRVYDDQSNTILTPGDMVITSHFPIWHVRNGRVKKYSFDEIDLQKIIYNDPEFNYLEHDNLNNFRTDYSSLKEIENK